MEVQTATNKDGKAPAGSSEKELLKEAFKSGRSRSKFKSVEEVVAEGVKKGEKDPKANAEAKAAAEDAEETAGPAMPDRIDIEVSEDGRATETATFADGTTSELQAKEEPTPALAEPEQTAEGAKEAPAAGAVKIKIGERTFTSQDEAIAYAEDLERQRLVDEAFRQGIETAQQVAGSNPTAAAAVAPQEPETVPDIYYTNPAAYLKQRDEQILARATQAINEQAAKQERNKATWQKFWSDYPDLASNEATKDLTDKIYRENFDRLKHVKTEVALKEIATKTREMMKGLGVTILPQKTLPSITKPVVSSGSSSTTTRPRQEEKVLNWTQQMKNMKKAKAEARRGR